MGCQGKRQKKVGAPGIHEIPFNRFFNLTKVVKGNDCLIHTKKIE
jgi:hypothetical protein